jgi:uncharacterized protein (TIGR02302 family)
MKDPARERTKDADATDEGRNEGSALLEGRVRRSLAALLFERAWRIVISLSALALAFLAASWIGLWLETGPNGRIAGLAIFAAAAIFIVVRTGKGVLSRKLALARLDDAAPTELRPASSLSDTLAGGDKDPVTSTLWTLHKRRLEDVLRATPIAPPRPRLAEHDPFALRAAALVAVIAAAFAAGPDRGARLRAAFDWRMSSGAGTSARLDAWLDPPSYTGLPPIVLSGLGARDEKSRVVTAPVNSILRIRSSGEAPADVSTSGGFEAIGAPETEKSIGRAATRESEQSFKLIGPAQATIGGDAYEFSPTPDRPPSISLTDPPRNNTRGSMTLFYRTTDDYGVVSAEATFSPPLIDGKPSMRHTLFEPPKAPLSLPGGRAGIGDSQTTIDLADHPFAGAHTLMTLIARDDAGNEGLSAPSQVTLPQRRFTKPLARALVEQRRNLVLDPEQSARVHDALDALSIAPEVFGLPSSLYLGLRTAKLGLESARSDDDLRVVADMLWAMALSLEDGDISQAERDLRAAERNLREALSRGADEREIAQLTAELRSALDNFLKAMTEQAMRNGNKSPPQNSQGNARSLSEQDVKSLLDQMEKAGKSGDLAQAQQLLDELQEMMENLQPSQGGASPESREMARSLSEIDRLSREQQQLRDDAHRGGIRSGETAADARAMRERQRALRQRLEQQRDRLRQLHEDPPRDLSDADAAMKEAEDSLGKSGDAARDKAVDAQGRAVQSLRRGADQLASRMKGDGEDGEDAEGQGRRSGRAGRQGQGDDPLGRSAGRRGGNNDRSRYDPLGLPPALRAHRVQEELRRRLGEPERPAEELDYIERLLRR